MSDGSSETGTPGATAVLERPAVKPLDDPDKEAAVHDVGKFKAWVEGFTSKLGKHNSSEQTTQAQVSPADQLKSNISRIEDFQKRYTDQTNTDAAPLEKTGTEG